MSQELVGMGKLAVTQKKSHLTSVQALTLFESGCNDP